MAQAVDEEILDRKGDGRVGPRHAHVRDKPKNSPVAHPSCTGPARERIQEQLEKWYHAKRTREKIESAALRVSKRFASLVVMHCTTNL